VAMSLKDRSDSWVNATFINTSNVCLQGPRGSQGTWLVTSQGTAAGKACTPQESSTSQFIQAEIARSSIHSGERATTQQDLSYSGERDPLAKTGTYRKESLDASICTLLGPQQVPFLYVFFLQGVPLLCHLVLC
jgi:hypothetical protein